MARPDLALPEKQGVGQSDRSDQRLAPHSNWQTPTALYDELNREFGFDFDPCPLMHDVTTWDGLSIDWKQSNFVNPPYDRRTKEAFVKKAYWESRKGKTCVLLLPVSTSSAIFHELIHPHAEVRFVRGRIRFKGVNTFGKTVGANGAPRHDSMIVIFRPGSSKMIQSDDWAIYSDR